VVIGYLFDPNNNQNFVLRSSFYLEKYVFYLQFTYSNPNTKAMVLPTLDIVVAMIVLVFIGPPSMMNLPGWFITSLLYSFIPKMNRGMEPKASKILKIIRPRYNPQGFLFFLDMFI